MSIELIEIARATLQAAMSTPELDTGVKSFNLLELFIEKTEERVKAGVKTEDLQFTTQELASALGIKGDSDTQRKEVNRLLKDVTTKLSEFRPAIQNRLLQKNYRETIAIDESTEGRRKYVFLTKIPLENREPSISDKSTPSLVHYEPISRKSIFGLNSFELNVKAGLILMGLLIIPWIFLVISIVVDAFVMDIQPYKIGFTLLMIPVFMFVMPFFRLFENGLILAPWWIKPTISRTAFLTLNHSDPNNKNRLKIVLLSYKAKCPICGAYLDVRKGKNQFKGRFIGQCEVTNEHSYTFDHVKERGVPAHTPMFIPDGTQV